MLSLQRAHATFAAVNVAGRAAKAASTPGVHWRRMMHRAEQVRQRGGRATAVDRLVMDTSHAAAYNLYGERVIALDLSRPMPLLLGLRNFGTLPWLWAGCEALVGRGHAPEPIGRPTYDDGPDQSWLDDAYNLHQCVAADGLLGLLLERAPLAAAARLAENGFARPAVACVLGAIAGRVALTPLRLAVLACAAGESVLCGLAVATTAMGLDAIGWTVQQGLERSGLEDCFGFRAFYKLATAWSDARAARPAALERAYVDDLEQAVDDGGPGLDERAMAKVDAALRRFRGLDGHGPEAARQADALAKQIADALRRYCANAPDERALCAGLRSLQTFMNRQAYCRDATWTTPELERAALRLRFAQELEQGWRQAVDDGGPGFNDRIASKTNATMRYFQAIDVDAPDADAQAAAMADQMAEAMRCYCANARDERALRGGLMLLRTFMELQFDGANWTAAEL